MAAPRTGQIDVLIMAAHGLELAALRTAIGADSSAILHGRSIRLAEVGVGAMLAGAGAMRALIEAAPRAALLVGSCGVYPSHAAFEPGQLVVPSRIIAVDNAVRSGRAAFPAPMPIDLEPDQALALALIAAGTDKTSAPLHAVLATTLAITTDDELALQLGHDSGCATENLEALAVALACRAQGVAFAALLGVTNEVGSRGRAQWREHHALAARNTAECVLRWVSGG